MWKKHLGKDGERAACEYLESLGMKILAQNWRYGRCELDIIAQQADVLHVVEVKTRWDDRYVDVRQLVRKSQQERLLTAAQAYVDLNRSTAAIQIDLLVVILHPAGGMHFEYIPDAICDNF